MNRINEVVGGGIFAEEEKNHNEFMGNIYGRHFECLPAASMGILN